MPHVKPPGLFPLPLPDWNVRLPRRRRGVRARRVRRLAKCVVRALNFLFFNSIGLQSCNVSFPVASRRLVDFVVLSCKRFVGSCPSHSEGVRGLLLVEFVKLFGDLGLRFDVVADSVYDVFSYSPNCLPHVPLVAAQVALPTDATIVPLLDLLPPAVARAYENECSVIMYRPYPRVRHAFGASQSEYVALLRRLLFVGMVELTAAVPPVVNGLFAVSKGESSLRLIIDARPANAAWVRCPYVDLPRPDLFARI